MFDEFEKVQQMNSQDFFNNGNMMNLD